MMSAKSLHACVHGPKLAARAAASLAAAPAVTLSFLRLAVSTIMYLIWIISPGGQPGVKVGSTVGVALTCVRKQQDEGLGVVVCMLFILITQRLR